MDIQTTDNTEQIDQMSKIDILDFHQVSTFGTTAQNSIASFSSNVTEAVKNKAYGRVGESLEALKAAINSTQMPEKKGLFGFLQNDKKKSEQMAARFDSAEKTVRKIEEDLQDYRQQLTRDVYLYELMYEENMKYYQELDLCVKAGKEALNKAREETMPQLQAKAELSKDPFDLQRVRDYEEACDRFDKKLYDLETTRTISLQMAPQIRLLQNSARQIADRLRGDIINTIPLWRNQMAIALGLEDSMTALNAHQSFSDTAVLTVEQINDNILSSIHAMNQFVSELQTEK